MPGNTSYSTLGTTTLANFADEIFDATIDNHPLLYMLKQSDNIKIVNGGTSFTHPLMYTTNSNFGAISKLGTIPTDIQDPYTRSDWAVKILAGSVVISMLEEAMNAGDKEKLIDLVESLKDNATLSQTELMGSQLWAASPGANDWNSIPQIVSSTASTDTNSIGSIDSSAATQAFWRPYVYTTAVTAFTASSNGRTAMDTMRINATKGKNGPTSVFTTAAIYRLYQMTLQANERWTKGGEGNAGFTSLAYCDMPVYFDDNCPADRMFMINTRAIRLQVLKKGNMKMTVFQQAYNQLVTRAILYMFSNITCGDRRTSATAASISG